ncbi:hypothetical protein CWB96_00225 [Pseudoalteromonas citrea]|uniref:Uncharacterized protein n=1 Tax=Pseudoalteromonas citrea TaxID=43655 RepID=A0A5S3XV83_9GAMM|nr:hypothetical protein [Pseudoalteromonas citrea]TMP46292.1 hypothetical protein CWB97_02220 [Pseudoalteromonas citrea]TMP63068.1 hypothetical protein CWB96_00225 [Pseudoalteromonas citrea]
MQNGANDSGSICDMVKLPFAALSEQGSVYCKVIILSVQDVIIQCLEGKLDLSACEREIGNVTDLIYCRDLVEKEFRLAVSEELTAIRRIAMQVLHDCT